VAAACFFLTCIVAPPGCRFLLVRFSARVSSGASVLLVFLLLLLFVSFSIMGSLPLRSSLSFPVVVVVLIFPPKLALISSLFFRAHLVEGARLFCVFLLRVPIHPPLRRLTHATHPAEQRMIQDLSMFHFPFPSFPPPFAHRFSFLILVKGCGHFGCGGESRGLPLISTAGHPFLRKGTFFSALF